MNNQAKGPESGLRPGAKLLFRSYSALLRQNPEIEIGNNNNIEEGVVIHKYVTIGNNNTIKKGTVIFPYTEIGHNNIILEDNWLGALPVQANLPFDKIKRNGLLIGNNNFFHIKNIISSGFHEETLIGNYNKFLSKVHISHDNIIHNHVTFYPGVFSAGFAEFFDRCNLGAGSHISQRCKIGSYSMVGMNGVATKNVLPFMVCINNKYTRLNEITFTDQIRSHKSQLEIILKFLQDHKECSVILEFITKEITSTFLRKFFFQIYNEIV